MSESCEHPFDALRYHAEQPGLPGEPSISLWNCRCKSTIAGPRPCHVCMGGGEIGRRVPGSGREIEWLECPHCHGLRYEVCDCGGRAA